MKCRNVCTLLSLTVISMIVVLNSLGQTLKPGQPPMHPTQPSQPVSPKPIPITGACGAEPRTARDTSARTTGSDCTINTDSTTRATFPIQSTSATQFQSTASVH
jgi:hypothetical protein